MNSRTCRVRKRKCNAPSQHKTVNGVPAARKLWSDHFLWSAKVET